MTRCRSAHWSSEWASPRPSVSHHLAKPPTVRRVQTRRADTIFYSLGNDHVRQLVVDAVFNAEHTGPGIPSRHRAEPAVRGKTAALPSRKIHQR